MIRTHMRVVLPQSFRALEATCQNSLNDPKASPPGETLLHDIREALIYIVGDSGLLIQTR